MNDSVNDVAGVCRTVIKASRKLKNSNCSTDIISWFLSH